jgi:hypothetical protein
MCLCLVNLDRQYDLPAYSHRNISEKTLQEELAVDYAFISVFHEV